MTAFGELLKQQRLKAPMGLREFAEFAGYSPSVYAMLENGRCSPSKFSRGEIARMADLLGFDEPERTELLRLRNEN